MISFQYYKKKNCFDIWDNLMFGFKWKKRAHVKPLGYTGKDHICGDYALKYPNSALLPQLLIMIEDARQNKLLNNKANV